MKQLIPQKRWLWPAVIVLAVGAAIGAYAWVQHGDTPEYKTVRIEKGAITASVAASGTLSPVVQVQVGSQVSGQLKDVLVDFNSEVKQGDLIARIDPQTFEHKVYQAQADLEAARAQVLTQQANIAAQRAEVSKAEVNAADALRDLERKQDLANKGFISAAERDKAQTTYNALAEQVKTAKAQSGVAAAGLRNAEAVVKQREAVLAQARIDLGRTEIKAPVNGVVIKRSVERGQTVAASLQAPELFIIAENLTDMQVDAAIDESEIGRIREGQKASFTVDAFPGRQFEGTVKQIRKAAQNVSNVVTYTVVINAANPKKELLPGMTANVRIVTANRDEVLKVANAALRFRPPGASNDKPAAMPTAAAAAPGAGAGNQSAAMRERLEKDLQLDDAQKAKLEALFAGMRDKFMAAREAPEAERQKIMERNRAEMRTQISAMLTPEQKAKYEEIQAESGERRSQGAGARSGRIYTLDENRQPKVLNVRLGLTDGTYTEVSSPEVKEGMEIITSGGQSASSSAARPQAPRGPRMF